MGGFSLWHWIIVLIVVLILFGRGRVADIMGEFGKGLKSFKQGMADDPVTPSAPPAPKLPASDSVPSASANEASKTDQP